MIYLDYSATTPVDREVLNSFNRVCLDYIGNTNSLHRLGVEARKLEQASIMQINNILGVKESDVIFTSGNNISTSTLSPVYNYTDGEVTTFSINNKDTTGTTVDYAVKLNITSIATELKNTSLKYVLLKNNTIVQEGDISSSYLYNDGIWWTMTPVGFTNSDFKEPTCMLYMSNRSELNPASVEYEWGIRPVISLKSSVIISGDGTINNPFTVD